MLLGSHAGDDLARALATAVAGSVLPTDEAPSAARRTHLQAADAAISQQHLLAQMHLSLGLNDEQLIGQLRKFPLVRELTASELDALFARARHLFFPRYSVLLREGNVGSCFFLLLHGCVRCTSSQSGNPTNTVLGAGACLGESALVAAEVRREATVVALEDSYLLQFTAADIEGLPITLPEGLVPDAEGEVRGAAPAPADAASVLPTPGAAAAQDAAAAPAATPVPAVPALLDTAAPAAAPASADPGAGERNRATNFRRHSQPPVIRDPAAAESANASPARRRATVAPTISR